MGKRKTLAAPARRNPPRIRARGGADTRFQRLIRLSTGFYWESDAAHRFTLMVHGPRYVSTQAPDSRIGKTRWEIPSTKPDAAGWEAHKAVLDAHLAFRDFEFARVGPDGAERQFVVSGEPAFDARGRFTGYCGIGEDVTERKPAEEMQHRFRAAIDLSADSIFLVDRATMRFIDVNTTACEEFGYTREELLQMGPHDLSGRSREQTERSYDELISGVRQARVHESALRRKDGSLMPGEIYRRAIPSPEGRTIVATVRNITRRKREEQLRHLEHTVTRCLSEADSMSGALKAAMRTVCETENWECARYFRVDDEAGVLRFAESWNAPIPGAERFVARSRNLLYGPGVGLTGAVWQSGRPLWIGDVTKDGRGSVAGLAQDTGIRGAFIFPITSEGKTIGVLGFFSRRIREPDATLLETVRVIGSQISQFLHRKQAEEALRESEQRFRGLTQMSSDFFWESDREHRLRRLVLGPTVSPLQFPGSPIGRTPWEMASVKPDAAGWAALEAMMNAHVPFHDFEYARSAKEGAIRHFSVSGEPRLAPDGEYAGYRGVGRDITELVEARERIASLAFNDALTGLANRTSLGPALEHAVQLARRHDRMLAIMFVDLDGFKQINDAHGHDTGDRLLIEAASRLRACLRTSDLVARLGGDEFIVLLEDMQDTNQVEAVASKLLAEIGRPYALVAGEESRVSASIGISMLPDDAGDPRTLMKHADTAMYRAKQSGKNGYRFFAGESADSGARVD